MKTFYTFLLISILSFSQAQTESAGKWKVGFNYSTDFYLKSTTVSTDEYSGYQITPSALNFTTGFLAYYPIRNKFEVGLGVDYSNKDYSGLVYCHVCDFAFEIKHQKIKQRFIELPLIVSYKLLQKKIGINIESGIRYSHLISDISTKYGMEPETNNYMLLTHIGIGFDYALNETIKIGLEPYYKQSITKFYKSSDFNFTSIGIKTNILYQF